MKKSVKISLLIVALLFVTGLMAVLIKKQPTQILFYSDTCPHCKIVEQYIKDNNVKNYLAFDELEISKNPANSQLLMKKATTCGMLTDNLGVPFFFDGVNCYMGDQEITNYFSSKK